MISDPILLSDWHPVARAKAVRAAHTIRGQASRFSLVHRFKLWQRYMFTVLINGLRKAEMAATALECRGFGAYPKRVYLKPLEFNPHGLWLVIVFIFGVTGLLILEIAV